MAGQSGERLPSNVPLILFSGMGADERVFAPQQKVFPNLIVPRWIEPGRDETLARYAARMARVIDPGGPCVIGGASFGGFVAAVRRLTGRRVCGAISGTRRTPRIGGRQMAKHSPRFLKIVEDVKQHIKECTVGDVKRKMDRNETFHLVDVREESEFAKGHIPGALHLGKGVIERDIETALPDANAEIVLYCGGGFRSALAADNLRKMGYTNVISMDGGWRGWTEAGLPTKKD